MENDDNIVSRLDIGFTVVMDKDISNYIKRAISFPRLIRGIYGNFNSVIFFRGKRKLLIYDKNAEVSSRSNSRIPEDYVNRNVLRFEYGLYNSSSIKYHFKRKKALTVKELLSFEFHEECKDILSDVVSKLKMSNAADVPLSFDNVRTLKDALVMKVISNPENVTGLLNEIDTERKNGNISSQQAVRLKNSLRSVLDSNSSIDTYDYENELKTKLIAKINSF